MMRLGGDTARRVIAVLVLAGMLLGMGVGALELARAQVPQVPLPLPTGEPPSEEPQPSPEPEPEPEPEPTFSPEPEPTWAPSETFPVAPYSPAPIPTQDVVSGVAPTTAPPASAAPRPPAHTVVTGISPVAAALPGAWAITLAAVLSVTGLGTGMLALAKRGLFAARGEDGGIDVEATKRWRLLGGLALLGAAAVVGVVGWYNLSDEPQVAVQIVYLASTGFAVLVLAVAGGSLVIADQLRADERRLREVEDALVNLAGQIQPLVSEPPRIIERGGRAKAFDPDVTTEIR